MADEAHNNNSSSCSKIEIKMKIKIKKAKQNKLINRFKKRKKEREIPITSRHES